MKNFSFSLTALLALFLISCEKDSISETLEIETYDYHAVLEEVKYKLYDSKDEFLSECYYFSISELTYDYYIHKYSGILNRSNGVIDVDITYSGLRLLNTDGSGIRVRATHNYDYSEYVIDKIIYPQGEFFWGISSKEKLEWDIETVSGENTIKVLGTYGTFLRYCEGADGSTGEEELDSDGDGILDDVDNCPQTPNPDQLDTDGDGLGDLCDDDDDNDGLIDRFDNCPLISNPDQLDTDNDYIGDLCDDDDDNDGILDINDNCPLNHNVDQLDYDGDGQGDVCDEDDDNDGIVDTLDPTPLSNIEATVQVGTCDSNIDNQNLGDGNTISDLIDKFENTEFKNNGQFRKAAAQLAESLVDQGLISEDEKDALMTCAGTGI